MDKTPWQVACDAYCGSSHERDTDNVSEYGKEQFTRVYKSVIAHARPRIEAEARAAAVALLDKIDRKAEAGLCCFTLESAREFLIDIRKIVEAARPK